MAIPNRTRVQLQSEGASDPSDLVDFDSDGIDRISNNLRKPGSREPDPDPNTAPGSVIPVPPFIFSAKSQMRLASSCDLVRYYETVGRMIAVDNMRWNPVIKNFKKQWESLKKHEKDENSIETPKISKSLPIIMWSEAFILLDLERCL